MTNGPPSFRQRRNNIVLEIFGATTHCISLLLLQYSGEAGEIRGAHHRAIQETVVDAWIDKAEDENYVARHECLFVQVGTKFYMFGGRESPRRLDIYDYTTNLWTTGSSVPQDLNHFQATEYEGLIWHSKTINFQ